MTTGASLSHHSWRTAYCAGLVMAAVSLPLIAQRPLMFEEVASLPAPPPDERIAYGRDRLQFGHLRLPRSPGPHPVMLFVHGGCYLSQYTIAHVAALEQAFADAGYAVWSVEYRRVGDEGGGWPGTFRDVGDAADHLRTLAASRPLDLRRVVAAGHSAGANFALWLATRDRLRARSELRVDRPLPIAAVLALAPVPDLRALHAQGVCGNVIDTLMGGSPARVPERYADASPAERLPIGVPHALVLGGEDRAWGPTGRAYHARTLTVRDPLVRLVDVPSAGHFDLIAPTSPSWTLVMQALMDLSRAMPGA